MQQAAPLLNIGNDCGYMGKYSEYTRKNTLRLKSHDYSTPGYYFVTILTGNREPFFGIIDNLRVVLTDMGVIAESALCAIPNHHSEASIDSSIIMPNHIHCILKLQAQTQSKGAACCTRNDGSVTFNKSEYHSKIASNLGSLSVIIRNYKSSVTRQCREAGFSYFQWHRGFHDIVIRSEKQLNAITEYIRANPQNWDQDPENI